MRPQDLRIGCIVKLKDTGDIVRVCGLTSKKIRYHKGNDRSTNLSSRKYCETEGVRLYDVHDKFYCSQLSWDGNDDNENDYSYFGAYNPIKLHYLHELQNLHYALQGEELEVDL